MFIPKFQFPRGVYFKEVIRAGGVANFMAAI